MEQSDQKIHAFCLDGARGPESWFVPSWPVVRLKGGKTCVPRAEAWLPSTFLQDVA